MSMSEKLKKAGATIKRPSLEPLWRGPRWTQDESGDGVTQSLLSRYLSCKERFRIYVIEGLHPVDAFSARMEYGNLWHVCEEHYARNPKGDDWIKALLNYCKKLCRRYPLQQAEIQKWYNVCKVQFPIYIAWWKKHPDVKEREPLYQEEVFDVPYRLPSGRVVRLRGKMDGLDAIGKKKEAGIYLQENKAKGDINEEQLKRQLTFDLQTMTYLSVLHTLDQYAQEGVDFGYPTEEILPCDASWGNLPDLPIRGVRYNVIRRPLAGGKGSIVQGKGSDGSKCSRASCRETPSPSCTACGGRGRVGGKPPESDADYYARLEEIINTSIEDNGDHYFFMRWKVEVTKGDVEKFRRRALDPILENLCDDYEWWAFCKRKDEDPFNSLLRQEIYPEHLPRHFQLPFGVYNAIAEGRSSDLDEYLATGSEVGLERATCLFNELTDESV